MCEGQRLRPRTLVALSRSSVRACTRTGTHMPGGQLCVDGPAGSGCVCAGCSSSRLACACAHATAAKHTVDRARFGSAVDVAELSGLLSMRSLNPGGPTRPRFFPRGRPNTGAAQRLRLVATGNQNKKSTHHPPALTALTHRSAPIDFIITSTISSHRQQHEHRN